MPNRNLLLLYCSDEMYLEDYTRITSKDDASPFRAIDRKNNTVVLTLFYFFGFVSSFQGY